MEQDSTGKSPRGNTRERIMAAATAVAHAVGPAHLSLDAVAEQAGVSKGGLLYHFPTKASLIKAIIEQHLDTVERTAGMSADDLAPDGDSVAVSLMRAFSVTPSAKPGGAQAFLAALAETPSLLEPIRAHHSRVAECLRRSREPEIALMAFLVIEGLRSLQMFDSNPLTSEESARIFATLGEILACSKAGGTA